MKEKINAVIFDYGCVISYDQNRDHVSAMIGLSGKDIKYDDFILVYRKYRGDYDLGIISGTDYWKFIMSEFGVNPDEETITKLVNLDNKSWSDINNKTLDLIKKIRVKKAILSNMPLDLVEGFIRSAFWYRLFDVRVFSSELKIKKPDSRIYEKCIIELDEKAGNCLFIDDLSENTSAAEKAGLNAITFRGIDLLLKEIDLRYSEILY